MTDGAPPPERNGWMDQIRAKLDRTWPERDLLLAKIGDGPLRPAAVLIPLYVRDGSLWTLFTKRTDTVEHHKGQISFPGGGQHPEDGNLWVTAIRETEEEIGVPRESIRLLGALPRMITVTDFEVSPFVGAIPYPVEFRPEAGEVEKIIEIPISYLLDPQVVEERPIRWKGQDVKTLVYHYHGHAIWGATARILADLLEALRGEPAAS
ncbi:MAG: NUDIX hydrolase [Thermoanaerobaculia bacterium]